MNVLVTLVKQRGRVLVRDQPLAFRLCPGCFKHLLGHLMEEQA